MADAYMARVGVWVHPLQPAPHWQVPLVLGRSAGSLRPRRANVLRAGPAVCACAHVQLDRGRHQPATQPHFPPRCFMASVKASSRPWCCAAEHLFEQGSEQRAWIEADLRAVNRSRTPWVVVGGHRPVSDHCDLTRCCLRRLRRATRQCGQGSLLSAGFHSLSAEHGLHELS